MTSLKVSSTANVDAYVEVLEEKSLLRQLYYATGKISRDILEGKDSFSIVGERALKRLE
jgi:replicative DNA helicase